MTQPVPANPRGTILGLRPGQIVDGRLEILNLIGYGGQGVVLKVKHLEWDRFLALKLPLPEVVQSPVNRERYLQEAETWIRLGVHPHVVRCWFVQNISGLPGLFLDLIPGGSLEDKIKQGEFQGNNWAKILRVLLEVTEGLSHSHSMGVVHRDLKPENILVHEDGSYCLTDFGLVKGFNDPSREPDDPNAPTPTDSSVTGTGQFVGTPRYGAPEQWDKSLEITPATDIYALGVIFYEMLAGRRPFDAPGENPDPLTLIHRHLQNPVPDPRTFRSDIPEALADVAVHCLSKNPLHRPQSAEQMAEILSGLLKHLCGEDYFPPAPVPGGEKPDLLNNAAVSLYSLGKLDKARELLRRGLLLQAGHPQCLYNLVQLDRREGKITAGESLRILRRANAKYEMALICLEEGLGKQAMELLESIPSSEKNGLIYRIEGDALMYAKQYLMAQRAYERAQTYMPYDLPTRNRKILASQGMRGHDGHVSFPSSNCSYQNRAPNADLRLLLSWNGERLIGITHEEVVSIGIETGEVTGHCPRPEGATAPVKAWVAYNELLIQDRGGFELWSVPDNEPLKRQTGRVLAVTDDLKRMVVLKSDGVYLVDKTRKRADMLHFPPDTPQAPYVQACFTPDQTGLCLLTPSGHVAQVDDKYRVIPLAWPPSVPLFQEVVCYQLGMRGVLYILGRGGHFQAIDLGKRAIEFSLKLPYQPESLTLDSQEQRLVISSPTEFGILRANGKVEMRGPGPCAVDPTRRFVMLWTKGYMSLYNLTPFRRLRTWADKIDQPVSIYFCQNASRAVSLCPSGEHHVWEVDEPNRVFERNLLLTPGETYEQLIKSYDSYLQLFRQSVRLVETRRNFHAYQTLKNARKVPGFLQAPEALELQWELCSRLKRFAMEAIWERLYTNDVQCTALSDDNQKLFLATLGEWVVREFGMAGGALVLSGGVDAPILAARYITQGTESPTLVFVTAQGRAVWKNGKDGSEIHSQDLELGPLESAQSVSDQFFLRAVSGRLAFYDIASQTVRSSFQPQGIEVKQAFPLQKDRVLLLSDRGPVTADLKRGNLQSGLPCALNELPGEVTFASETSDGLYVLGFSDGTLYVLGPRGGKLMFAVNHKKGAITAARFHRGMGLGVSVTSGGRLCLFDLARGGEPFELFTAHNEPITGLQISSNARYVSTRTAGGQFRFWEISWTLSEESGEVVVDWWPTGALSKLGRMLGF